MKSVFAFLKTTIIGGVFFIVPMALLLYIVVKIIEVLRKLVAPIAEKIEFSFLGGETTARIIALIVLLLLCFVAGLLAKSKKMSSLKNWAENNILSNIPGYSLIKGMSETVAGIESNNLKEVVLVDIEEVWQIGFLMERIDDDLNAVFIPGALNPMSGDVMLVKWDRLKILDISGVDTMKIYRKLGVDSKAILTGKMDKSSFD